MFSTRLCRGLATTTTKVTEAKPPMAWPRPGSPEWIALTRRPPDKEVPVNVAMGYEPKQQTQQPRQEQRRRPPEPHLSEGAKRLAAFGLRPREIKALLDERVIGQVEAKKSIAVAISEHYHHARLCLEEPGRLARHFHKPNMLIWGPSGSGKSHLIRAAADLAAAPLVKCDATKYSATGYVGRDVTDIVTQLVEAADGDVSVAQFGLVHVDEVDKICDKKSALTGLSAPGGVNTRDVQHSLLKMLEDLEVPLPSKNVIRKDKNSTFSTKHVLFVFTGAFDDPAKARPGSAADFIDLGLIPEFVGRLPVRVSLAELTVGELHQILATPSDVSPLSRYVETFAAHGIKFTYDDEALRLIADRAHTQRLGARALLTEVEATLRDFSYHLPSCDVDAFHLGPAAVDDPRAALRTLLGLPDDVDPDLLL